MVLHTIDYTDAQLDSLDKLFELENIDLTCNSTQSPEHAKIDLIKNIKVKIIYLESELLKFRIDINKTKNGPDESYNSWKETETSREDQGDSYPRPESMTEPMKIMLQMIAHDQMAFRHQSE
ncbi:hypothetical protein F53441_1277 [Fusarium austroafricanum]|uniref:Uncharacterized protein n=1 Tax=Fusarium austroafricanum TaxID=2364996 RepID=A0A8H4KVU5_9HYPO|nr:hypothetical protein F53441_1277 [Fusarium austroafricanum]